MRLADQLRLFASVRRPQGTLQVLMNHRSSARGGQGVAPTAAEAPANVAAPTAVCRKWRRCKFILAFTLTVGRRAQHRRRLWKCSMFATSVEQLANRMLKKIQRLRLHLVSRGVVLSAERNPSESIGALP